MEYSRKLNDQSCDIDISGRFTREDSEQIQSLVSYINEHKVTILHINMQKLDFIDSSAIGQLLVLKEEIDKNKGSITLKNPTGHVKEMLDVSNFEQFFNIVE